MTLTSNIYELTVRDALVIVGLLEESDARRKAAEAGGLRPDGFVDSLRKLNLMEVLNYPIWGKSRQEQEELRKSLLELHQVTDEDVRLALDAVPPSGKDLPTLLLDRGLVDQKTLERAWSRHRNEAIPLWRVLVAQDTLKPQQVGQMLLQRQGTLRVQQAERRILELLEVLELLPSEKLAEILRERSTKGGSVLRYITDSGILSRYRILETLQPYEEMSLVTIDVDRRPGLDILFALPISLTREASIVPLAKSGQVMTVGLIDPRGVQRLGELEQTTGFTLRPVLISRADFEREMARLAQPDQEAPRLVLKDLILASRGRTASGMPEGSSPAVQLTKSILDGALSARATDVHLEPQKTEMRVRFRIDGRLYDVMNVPREIEAEVLARIKILADMDIAERRRPQDGHFAIAFGGKDYNMRISTLPTHMGEKLALRILDESTVVRGISHLGLEPEDRELFEQLIHKPNGMILVTGPIGSGKSTTLYSALGALNMPETNIVTIEDPVEYQLLGINQVQVEPDIGVTFAAGLRAILRQDADILMVGEIRDPETARVAAWAAMTGQLVLCTLHTGDAVSAVTMIVNFGVERFVAASAIIGVAAQRLVRRLCPDCKEPYPVAPAMAAQLGLSAEEGLQFYKAKGCNFCFHTGFYGRIGVYELFVISDPIRELLLNGSPEAELRKAAATSGMRSLRQNGLKKVLEGKTTLEEVMREIAL